MKLTIVAGARPNFMKIAPLIHSIQRAQERGAQIHFRLVHTGQHYDRTMSDSFFEELNIPTPDVNLGVGGGTQAEQTAGIMIAFERELMGHPVDLVIVVGDVTSTMACSIVAKKLLVKVAHVEAGIRSWDQTMPEEINRMVTDSITDFFFTTSEHANENLLRSGVTPDRLFFVGNVMIDTLLKNQDRLRKPYFFDAFSLKAKDYFVLTMHRPSNVDEQEKLQETLSVILESADGKPILFPIHPRTAKIVASLSLNAPNLHIVDPLGYLEFNYLVKNALAVITDSGGITEETTVMGVPCITLRENTERPETCELGTNELIGTDPQAIRGALSRVLQGAWKEGAIPPLWDGKSADRIINHLLKLFC